MAKYRKRPIVVEANQWFRDGDHSKVEKYINYESKLSCGKCGKGSQFHGWITSHETGGYKVCPRDWIIKDIVGKYYPCKPDIFEATYEPEKEDEK
jgi:hypothetical protein